MGALLLNAALLLTLMMIPHGGSQESPLVNQLESLINNGLKCNINDDTCATDCPMTFQKFVGASANIVGGFCVTNLVPAAPFFPFVCCCNTPEEAMANMAIIGNAPVTQEEEQSLRCTSIGSMGLIETMPDTTPDPIDLSSVVDGIGDFLVGLVKGLTGAEDE